MDDERVPSLRNQNRKLAGLCTVSMSHVTSCKPWQCFSILGAEPRVPHNQCFIFHPHNFFCHFSELNLVHVHEVSIYIEYSYNRLHALVARKRHQHKAHYKILLFPVEVDKALDSYSLDCLTLQEVFTVPLRDDQDHQDHQGTGGHPTGPMFNKLHASWNIVPPKQGDPATQTIKGFEVSEMGPECTSVVSILEWK
jgi:hypothetical protein